MTDYIKRTESGYGRSMFYVDKKSLYVNYFDFEVLPFADEAFLWLTLEPPHLKNSLGNLSGLFNKCDELPEDWRSYLNKGFWECWRVLNKRGLLIFRWNVTQIPVNEVIRAIGWEHAYEVHDVVGQPRSRALLFSKGVK